MLLTIPENIRRVLDLPQVQYVHDSLPKSKTAKPWPMRPQSAINETVVHHSADTGLIENEALYHINNRGWYTISYHISIDRGEILQLNDFLMRTTHASGANDRSIGVCVNGKLHTRPMTDFERRALIGVNLAIQELFPNIKISGHNEVGKRNGYGTTCPAISMDQLRSDIMTEGLKVEVSNTPNDQLQKAFAVQARVADIYKVASAPGKYQSEGNRKMAKMYDWMKAEGLI